MYTNSTPRCTLDKQMLQNGGGIAHTRSPGRHRSKFLPYKTTLREIQQGKKISIGSFIAGLKLFRPDSGEIEVKPGVFRIQTRNGASHKVSLSLNSEKKSASEAYCSSIGGYV